MSVGDVILIADDDDNDVLLLRRALATAGIENELRVVDDGEAAICYLKGEGRYENRALYPFPIVMFLNLQMPRKNGGEVLAWLSAQAALPRLRLIVLSGSLNPKQLTQAVHLGAQQFLSKPPDADELLKVLKEVQGVQLVSTATGYKLSWSAFS